MQFNTEEPTAAHGQLLAALRIAADGVRLTLSATTAAIDLLPFGAHVDASDLDDLRELLRRAPACGLGDVCALPARVVRPDARIGARFAAMRVTQWDARTDRGGACFDAVVELLAAAPYHPDVAVRFTLGYEPGVDGEPRVGLRVHDAEPREPRNPRAITPAHVELLGDLRRVSAAISGEGLRTVLDEYVTTLSLALLLSDDVAAQAQHAEELAALLVRVLRECQIDEVLEIADDAGSQQPEIEAALDGVRLLDWRPEWHAGGPAMRGHFHCYMRDGHPAVRVEAEIRRRVAADGGSSLECAVTAIDLAGAIR